MKELEDKIEQLALGLSGLKPNFDRKEEEYYQSEKVKVYDLTKQVIKSSEAKEYWFSIFEKDRSQTEKRLDEYIKNNFDGKPSYSEEEVRKLLKLIKSTQNFAKQAKIPCDIIEISEQNKKK